MITRSLGWIADTTGGVIRTGPFGSQLHESDYSIEGTPVVMPKDIIDGRVSEATIARVDDEHLERLAGHILAEGDIVYGRRGDIGRRALISQREAGWLCGTGCLRISLDDSMIDPTFLYYYLGQPHVINWIYNQAVGATLPNLNTSILRSVEITYPEIGMQREIAGILSAYDDLIENNTRRIAILEEMARKLYREWFVEFCFPGHEQVPMVDSEVGLVPKGWAIQAVSDIAQLHRGRSYRSVNLAEDGGLPFLTLKCIDRDGGFRSDGIKRYDGIYKDSQTAKVRDILIAVTDMTQERRIVARAARVPNLGHDRSVYSMDLVKIEPLDSLNREFLYGMLRFSDFPDETKHHANGTNVLHLNPERIRTYRFSLPDEALRRRYAEVVGPMYDACDLIARSTANLRSTRDLLLPKLIAGEIDVSNLPNLIPA